MNLIGKSNARISRTASRTKTSRDRHRMDSRTARAQIIMDAMIMAPRIIAMVLCAV